ncbi:hypothetical protein [uncultured Methylobacterium sp.]|uniref:hypothetical protein n=1 Tax=uncultured Methylobacterium sp. TaxID=157278 RepID=UPI0035CAE0A4
MSTDGTFRCAEFECGECGRHIVLITSPVVPEIPLCGSCQFMPGWFRHPGLRAAIDPEHDGRERLEKDAHR